MNRTLNDVMFCGQIENEEKRIVSLRAGIVMVCFSFFSAEGIGFKVGK